MYGYNRYAPGTVPNTTRFFRPDGGNMQLGVGNLADKIRSSIDARRNAPQAGQAAGMAAANASRMASPAGRQNTQFARNAMLPRPMGPGGTPDYGLGTPNANPTPIQAASPYQSAQYSAAQMGAPPGGPAPMPGAGPGMPPPRPMPAQGTQPGMQPPQPQPQPPAPGQAPMVNPQAMVDTLNTPINPQNYQAHSVGGRTVLLRNGADPQNTRPGDLMAYDNGQWVPAGDDVGQDLYNQLHITAPGG